MTDMRMLGKRLQNRPGQGRDRTETQDSRETHGGGCGLQAGLAHSWALRVPGEWSGEPAVGMWLGCKREFNREMPPRSPLWRRDLTGNPGTPTSGRSPRRGMRREGAENQGADEKAVAGPLLCLMWWDVVSGEGPEKDLPGRSDGPKRGKARSKCTERGF